MSESTINNTQQDNVLYKSGRIETTLDFALTNTEFRSLETIDLTKLNPNKLSIDIFAQTNDNLGGTPVGDSGWFLQGNALTAFYVNVASGPGRYEATYQLRNGILYIGVYNTVGADVTPIAPYLPALIDYYIFYY